MIVMGCLHQENGWEEVVGRRVSDRFMDRGGKGPKATAAEEEKSDREGWDGEWNGRLVVDDKEERRVLK